MAQTQSTTNEGYTGLGILVSGEDTTEVVKSIVNIGTSCTADATQTYSGITKLADGGMEIADGTVTSVTTTVTDDTVQVTNAFSATATNSILGSAMCCDNNDRIYMLACWSATISVENGDTFTPTLKLQFKAD